MRLSHSILIFLQKDKSRQNVENMRKMKKNNFKINTFFNVWIQPDYPLPTHPLLSDLFFNKWASGEENQWQHIDTLSIRCHSVNSRREVDCIHPEGLSEHGGKKGDSLKILSIPNLHMFVTHSHKYTHDNSAHLLCYVLEA